MNDLDLASIALAAIVAGIAAWLGGLLAQKLSGPSKARSIVAIIFGVGSIPLTNNTLVPMLQQEAGPYEAIRLMKRSPLFDVMFKYHPDAEAQTVQKLKEIMSGPSTSKDASVRAIRTVGAALVEKYANTHLLTASDDAVRNFLVSEEAILRSVRSQPEACVALYLHNANAPVELSSELLNAKLNAAANVIETSVTQPSPPPTTVTVDALRKILVRVYEAYGFDISEMSKLGDVSALPSKEGCEVAYHFTSAMASLDPKDAAMVYKGLLILAKQ